MFREQVESHKSTMALAKMLCTLGYICQLPFEAL